MKSFRRVALESLPTIFFAISLLGNVVLGSLALKWHRVGLIATMSRRDAPKVGTIVDSLQLLTVTGDHVNLPIAKRERPAVLYVFTPTCKWCAKNVDNIQHFFAATRDRYDYVGLSLTSSGLKEYLDRTRLNFQVYVVEKNQISQGINLTLTPETLVFDRDGRLQRVFDGYYTPETSKAISSYFGLNRDGRTFFKD